MTIEEMKTRKKELGYSNKRLAELSGVSLGTLQKVFSGETKAPREDTVRALECALFPERMLPEEITILGVHRSIPPSEVNYTYGKSVSRPSVVADQGSRYGTETLKGNLLRAKAVEFGLKDVYTIEDYYALPGDRRVELIDGTFYDLAAPNTVHQMLAAEIYKALSEHIDRKGGNCVPFISPVDVQLDKDQWTMLQPDVLVVCDRDKIRKKCIFGAPDLIVEILSPSTRRIDLSKKFYKYSEAGVKECWFVDPERKAVVVYRLENFEIPMVFGFQDKVPVGIWDGECEVDFSAIYDRISFLLEEN